MLKLLDKRTPLFVGFVQSFLLTTYITLINGFFSNAERWFGNEDRFEIVAPVIMLTLFVSSALITGSIALGYPLYTLIVKKDAQRAIKVILSTILFAALLVVFIVSFVFSIISR